MQDEQSLTIYGNGQFSLETAATIANDIARQGRLEIYQRGLSAETLRRHKADIDLFKRYLESVPIPTGDMLHAIEAWRGISWGIVEGFREWQLQQGYAMGSINVRLSTVKKYAQVAYQSGMICNEDFRLIQSVKGFAGKQARNVDEKRTETRRGAKKGEATKISSSHMKALKKLLEEQSRTSKTGQRDYLLFCLLGYQGLRCSEVAALCIEDITIAEGQFIFYRRKVDKTQIHDLHPATLQAMQRYLSVRKPQGLLFDGVDHKAWTDKNGKVHKARYANQGLSTKAINERVAYFGELVEVARLSPHDLRHYWTTDLFKNKTPIDIVMQAGGWSSYVMPLRYRGDNTIANEGVKQSE